MSEQMNQLNIESFTVVTWNILLDYTRSKLEPNHRNYVVPQRDRVASQIATLADLGFELDVVCLQEVQGAQTSNNGELIAQSLGYKPGHWYNHNTSKRQGEYIGMFGNLVEATNPVQLRHDKIGVFTKAGNVAIVGTHNRFEPWGPMRREQTEDILLKLDGEDCAVVMGDMNDLKYERSRRLLKRAGFKSAFDLAGLPNPKTHPTAAYKDVIYKLPQKIAAPWGTVSDIIYVRGCDVLDAGVFEGESDHRGVWASLKPAA